MTGFGVPTDTAEIPVDGSPNVCNRENALKWTTWV